MSRSSNRAQFRKRKVRSKTALAQLLPRLLAAMKVVAWL